MFKLHRVHFFELFQYLLSRTPTSESVLFLNFRQLNHSKIYLIYANVLKNSEKSKQLEAFQSIGQVSIASILIIILCNDHSTLTHQSNKLQ